MDTGNGGGGGGGVEVLPHEVEDIVPHHGGLRILGPPKHRGQTPRRAHHLAQGSRTIR
jgi:hypothetical protein